LAEVRVGEVRVGEVRVGEVRVGEVRVGEVRADVWVLITPRVPGGHALLEQCHMIVVRHGSTPEVLRRTMLRWSMIASAPSRCPPTARARAARSASSGAPETSTQ